MPVDPSLPRKILIVHGVETSPDNLNQDALIDELLQGRLGGVPLAHVCELYRYKNIDAQVLARYQRLLNLILAVPLGQVVADAVLQVVGDVVISLEDGSTAAAIRQGLRQAILEIFEKGNPCYLVAHSLGSIYAFDVINALIGEGGYFERGSRTSWPVQGVITLGSPIGLDLFKPGRAGIKDFGAGDTWFRWLNLWDPNDPVVSGNIFGAHLSGFKIAEGYLSSNPEQGWAIRDIPLDTGKTWLMAHTAYWQSSVVGDKLVDMIGA